MDLGKLIQTLHPLERKVLPILSKLSSIKDIAKAAGLQEVEVMRALQWLQNKQIIILKEEQKEVVELDINGEKYIKEGLPEIRFLKAIKKEEPLSRIIEDAKLSDEEASVCLGVLRGKAAINIRKDKELFISIT